MSYKIKEIYYSLQGEGFHAGRKSVFCRFNSCNLWSGKEKDRDKAICKFCDTNFLGTDGLNGAEFDLAVDVASVIARVWKENVFDSKEKPYVVFTGGEPLLQLDNELILAVKDYDFEVAVETNGTLAAPSGIDWLTVSPKAGAKYEQRSGHELKLVFPQAELDPSDLESSDFEHFYLSPMEVSDKQESLENIAKVVSFCEKNPRWKVSLQFHKLLGMP